MFKKKFLVATCLLLAMTMLISACSGKKAATGNDSPPPSTATSEQTPAPEVEPEESLELTIHDYSGTVEAKHEGDGLDLSAQPKLTYGDTVKTGQDGTVTLLLGTVDYIILGESTEVKIEGKENNLSIWLTEGTVTSVLNDHIAGLDSYMVDTGNAQAYATGTVYTVSASKVDKEHTTVISMFEGSTKVTIGGNNESPIELATEKVLTVVNSADTLTSSESDIDFTTFANALLAAISDLSSSPKDWLAKAEQILTARAETEAAAEAEKKAQEEATRQQQAEQNQQQSNQQPNNNQQNNTPQPQPQPVTITRMENAQMALNQFTSYGWSSNGIAVARDTPEYGSLGWNTTLTKGDVKLIVGIVSHDNTTRYDVEYYEVQRGYEVLSWGGGVAQLLQDLQTY